MSTELDACIRHAAKSLVALDKTAVGRDARFDLATLQVEWLAERAGVTPPYHAVKPLSDAVDECRSLPFVEAFLRRTFAGLPKASSWFEQSPFAFGDAFNTIFGVKQ